MELIDVLCGTYPLLDEDDLFQDKPVISVCLEDTILVWIPYGYHWLCLVPFSVYLYRKEREDPLPFHTLQVVKQMLTVTIIALVGVELFLKTETGYHCRGETDLINATYVAAEIKAATLFMIMLQEEAMRHIGIKSCIVSFTFWLLVVVFEIAPLYSLITINNWCAASIVTCVKFAIMCLQLVLRCFADQYDSLKEQPLSLENASFVSRITYTWIFPLVLKAYRTPSAVDRTCTRTRYLESNTVVRKFLTSWSEEARKREKRWKRLHIEDKRYQKTTANEKTPLLAQMRNKSIQADDNSYHKKDTAKAATTGPSIFLVLWRMHRGMWAEATIYKVLGDTFDLLQPLVLNFIIQMVEDTTNHYPRWMKFALSLVLFISSMMKTFCWNFAQYHQKIIGIKMKTAIIGALYRKTLTLSNTDRKTSTVGEIVNLMAVDCQRIQNSVTLSHQVISIPYVTTVSMLQLWYLIGPATFGGIGMIILMILINGVLGRWQTQFQGIVLRIKSQRINVLNEIMNGIKVIKMYTWEIPFERRVTGLRDKEDYILRKIAVVIAVALFLSFFSPFMVSYSFYVVHTLTQPVHYLDARTAFVVLALVSTIRHPVSLMSEIINRFVQGYVSLKRVQDFLWKEDMDIDNVAFTNDGDNNAVTIENGIFTWKENVLKPTLTGINIRVPEGKLYAVVGHVGSGKTSFISAILGEMDKLNGSVTFQGRVALVPQEAWIQNLTVRDNIVFGNPWDHNRYNKVLTGCALLPDLDIFPGRDLTEIGEKGINLSGGQKQRVSLARAVYSDADVYLLDDPLSAVDSHVGMHIFNNVIGPQGLLKHKTRILVTHGVHWLPTVDKVIVMADGQISSVGTYQELLVRDRYFANLLQTFWDEETEDYEEFKDRISCNQKERVYNISSRKHTNPEERNNVRGMSFSTEDSSLINETSLEDHQHRLIEEERSEEGGVKFQVFKSYVKAMGYKATCIALLLMIVYQSLSVYSNYWITYWTEDPLLRNLTLGHTQQYENKFIYYLMGYSSIGALQGTAMLIFGLVISLRMAHASGVMHNSMLKSVLRSPMYFFDTTPVGRIMNRFSSDIDIMDITIPYVIRWLSIQVFQLASIVVVVSINTPTILSVIAVVTLCYFMLLKFYLPVARQVTRLESVTRSPIFNHFSETISGAPVIRAFKCSDRFIAECDERVDNNLKFMFASICAAKWNGICLKTLGNFLILATSVFVTTTGLNGALVGLSITYALQITQSLLRAAQLISELEMRVISIERVKHYTDLQPEAPWLIESSRKKTTWPKNGCVEFRSYMTRYRDGLDLTLKGISCFIGTGEKVGIVGRTGAGKSSLALSLFRLIESAGGAIIIDDVDISTLGLHDLRNKLTILPQDPVLFSGSLRENIDPFGRFDDDEMWQALESAHLKKTVESLPEKLLYECGEAGGNLSVGQKQLVCLARTLLHKTKILVLDEATSAVDLETDELIQTTIRSEFRDCTIITIAHRLNTVLDYDRIIVLSDGQILEMGLPGKLLQDSSSYFFKMAKDAGLVTKLSS